MMPAVESAEALKEKLAKILIGRARRNANIFMSVVKLMSLTLLDCYYNAVSKTPRCDRLLSGRFAPSRANSPTYL